VARYTAIADVSETLLTLVRDRLGDHLGTPAERQAAVALATPSVETVEGPVRIGFYLYGVAENGHLRGGDPTAVAGVADAPQRYALDLRYLLTAYPPQNTDDTTQAARSQQELLGQTVHLLHENAVLRGSELTDAPGGGDAGPSLSGDAELRLSVVPEPTETLTNIWNTFPDTPFQPSVAYLVGPVAIDAPEPEPIARRAEEKVDRYVDSDPEASP
jgi:hypothetical protein